MGECGGRPEYMVFLYQITHLRWSPSPASHPLSPAGQTARPSPALAQDNSQPVCGLRPPAPLYIQAARKNKSRKKISRGKNKSRKSGNLSLPSQHIKHFHQIGCQI